MKENSNPNGFFLACEQEVSAFEKGKLILEGRRGVFPTLEFLHKSCDEHPLDSLKNYSVIFVCVDGCGELDPNQKFVFKPKTATVVDVKKLSEVRNPIASSQEEVAIQ